MGPLTLTSDNLILRVENELSAKNVLDLYLRNRISFEQFEPTRPHDFYTIDYHEAMLRREYKAYLYGTFIRYYIYKKSNVNRIIGSVNFNFMHSSTETYAEIGYKVDALYQNHGIAYDACCMGIDVLQRYYGITRIDARIHPDNEASLHLAKKLGFVPVQYEPQSANIMGHYVDLIRYSRRTSDTQ